MATYAELKQQRQADIGAGTQGAENDTTTLSLSGNTIGDLKLTKNNNNLLMWNGSGWYKVATLTNAAPTISSAGDASYTFAEDGTPIVIDITAADTEGAIDYGFTVSSGSLTNGGGTTATVTQGTGANTNRFTITPTTNNLYGGTFSLTFTASDGTNTTSSSASAFTLEFTLIAPASTQFHLKSADTRVANNSTFIDDGHSSSGTTFTVASTGGVSPNQSAFSPYLGDGYYSMFRGQSPHADDSTTSGRPKFTGLTAPGTDDFQLEFWNFLMGHDNDGNVHNDYQALVQFSPASSTSHTATDADSNSYPGIHIRQDRRLRITGFGNGNKCVHVADAPEDVIFGDDHNIVDADRKKAPERRWVHYALVRYKGYNRLYIDGKAQRLGYSQTGGTSSSYTQSHEDNTLGNWTQWCGDPFNVQNHDDCNSIDVGWYYDPSQTGKDYYIADLRYIKGTSNITYTSNFTPPTSPLTAVTGTQLLTCRSRYFKDFSSNNCTYSFSGAGTSWSQMYIRPHVSGFSPYGKSHIAARDNPGSVHFIETGTTLKYQNSSSIFNTTNWTKEWWLYKRNAGDHDYLIDHGGNTGLMYFTSSDLNINFYDPHFSFDYTEYFNQWTHFAWVKNGDASTYKLYVNGVEKVSNTGDMTPNATSIQFNDYSGGGGYGSSDSWFLSEYVHTNTAKYSANFTPPTTPIATSSSGLAHLKFNNYGVYDVTGATALNDIDLKTEDTSKLPSQGYYYFNDEDVRLTTQTVSSGELDFPASTPFTIEFWYKLVATPGNSSYFFALKDYQIAIHYYGSYSSHNQPHIQAYFSAGDRVIGNSNTGTALNTWYHLALVRNSSDTVNLYIDGVKQTTGAGGSASDSEQTNANGWTGSSATLIRINGYGGGGSGAGYIGQNCYYSNYRVVSGTAVYTGNFTPPTGPLTKTGGEYSSTTNVNTSIPSAHTILLTAQNSSGSYVDNSDNALTLTKSTVGTGDILINKDKNLDQDHPIKFDMSSDRLNTALVYQTSGDYIAQQASHLLSPESFTIEGFVKQDASGSNADQYILGDIDGSEGQFGVYYDVSEPGIKAKFRTATSSEVTTSTTLPLAQDTWGHFAYTYKNNVVQGYLNGVLYSVDGFTDRLHRHISPFTGLEIGGRMSNADSPTSSSTSNDEMFGTIDTSTQFKGLIEDIRISKGVVYDPITVPTSNLTAVTGTVMLTGQTNYGTISDASSSNHTLTVNGDAVYSNYCPFINAVSFDSGTRAHNLNYRIGYGDTASNETDVHTSFNVETGDWTLEWWIKKDSTAATYETVFAADGALALEFKNDNKLYMWLNSKAGVAATWDLYNEQLLGSAITNGKWSHMALTRDGNYFYFYQDGNRITSLAQSSSTEIKHWLDDTTVGINLMSYNNSNVLPGGASTSFDGSGDYIDTTNPLSGTGDFTMEGWIYHTTSGSYDGYFSTCLDTGANGGIVVGIDKFFVTHGGGSSQIGWTGGAIGSNSVWYHVCLQRISNVFYLYKDGVQQGSASATVSLTGSTIRLGSRYSNNTTHMLTGYISNFRIVTGSAVYASGGFTPPTSPLTAISGTQLLTCQNSTGTITDASSNGYTITANGDAAADAQTPFTSSYDNCTGSLSNFRFVKGSAVYSGATYTVPTSNLTAISGTQLLTCQSGNLMTDASTNNHVIRLGSNSSYVNHKPAPTYESPFSGSIYFDGTDDYITAAGHADFAFGSGDFTIEMFVRQTDKSAGEGFYQIGHSSAPFDADTTNVAAGWYNHGGTIAYRVYGNNTGINSTNAMSPSDNDRWHHHIYMRKSGTSYVIIDGRVINKFSDSINYTDNHFTLGGYYSTSWLITGYISNFRVVKGSAVYNPDFTALTTELA